MSVKIAIERLNEEQKRNIYLCIFHDKKKLIKDSNLLNVKIYEYLENYVKSITKAHKQSNIISIWLKYILEILKKVEMASSTSYMLEILKNDIEYDLNSLDSLNSDDLDDKVEAVCRQLVLILMKESISNNCLLDVKKIINSNIEYSKLKLVKKYDKYIRRGNVKGAGKVVLGIGSFLNKRADLGSKVLKEGFELIDQSKEIKRKKKFVKVMFSIYIDRYLNKKAVI